ncbi:MAG: hypothetical protein AB1797_00375 [bacterium]
MAHHWKAEKGIGLIGSVIAVAILMLVVLAVAALFRHGSILTVRTKTALRATHMIEEEMEELRGRGGKWFVDPNNNWQIGVPDIDYNVTVPIDNPATMTIFVNYWNDETDTIAPANIPDSRDYLKVEVKIDWQEDNVDRERQAVTYLNF